MTATDRVRAAAIAGRLVVPHAAEPRVSLIVLAAHRADLLAPCLAALPAATADGPSCETIIVLNGATPDVEALTRERVERARVVRSSVNLGVAGGANLGRDAARGQLLVLLHDDTEVQPGWLVALVAVADGHPEAGIVGSRVVSPDGRPQSAGGVVFADGQAVSLQDDPPANLSERAVDFCGSCALLVRAELWDSLGGLDEEFFPAYFVDVDSAISAWQAGWSVLCALHARVVHHRGASSPKSYREFVSERNRRRLRHKWADALSRQVATKDHREPRPLEMALERARLAAERTRREQTRRVESAHQPVPAGGAASEEPPEARARRLEAALQIEYVSYLKRRRRLLRLFRAAYANGRWRVRARHRQMLAVLDAVRKPTAG